MATNRTGMRVSLTIHHGAGGSVTYENLNPSEAVAMLAKYDERIQYVGEFDGGSQLLSAAQQIREAREDARRPR